MRPIETVVAALREHGKNPRQSGKGWSALCPAHDDHNPSLSINEGDDGRVLFKCFSQNCSANNIANAIGLRMSDLFCTSTRTPSHKPEQRRKTKTVKTYSTPEEGLVYLRATLGEPTHPRWTYFDSQGTILGYVYRFSIISNGKPEKPYQPLTLTPNGWVIQGIESPRPLFNLPKILNHNGLVLFFEGEKCCDLATELGYVSTTTYGGSNAPHLTDLSFLDGKEIWLFPDNDKPGKDYAKKLLQLFGQLNNKPKVKIVELPNLPPKGDIEQFLEQRKGHTRQAIADEIQALASKVKFHEWTKEKKKPEPEEEETLQLIWGSEIKMEPTKWLWPRCIPFGSLTLLSGLPGTGKSQVAAFLASVVSTGGTLPDGSTCPASKALYCSAEDAPAKTLLPRFVANNACSAKIGFPKGVVKKSTEPESEGETKPEKERSWNLLDTSLLEKCLNANPEIRFVVIDPIGSYVGGSTDTYRDNEVRHVLNPLKELAEKRELAVILICHLGKSKHLTADQNILGSTAFSGLARVSLHVQPDPKNEGSSLLLPGKNNLSPQSPGWRFSLESVELTNEKGELIETSKVCWSDEPVEGVNANTAYQGELSEGKKRGPEPRKLQEAKQFLTEFLADGARYKFMLDEEIRRRGISEATLKRAKENLGVLSYRSKGGLFCWSFVNQSEPQNEFEGCPVAWLQNPHTLRIELKDSDEYQKAQTWLLDRMAQTEEPQMQSELAWKANYEAISYDALLQAARNLGTRFTDQDGVWFWALPCVQKKLEQPNPIETQMTENKGLTQEVQEKGNLSYLNDTQVSPPTENGCLPNCQEEQATETDDNLSPFVGRNLFEEYPDQRLPD